MARRGRLIGLAIGLFVAFMLITSRRSSGSHPKDMRAGNREKQRQQTLHPIIKEPPGKWDPEDDQFVQQHEASGVGDVHIDDIDPSKHQDLAAEGIKRKTPQKGGKNVDQTDHIKGQPEPLKRPAREGGGSGAVVTGDDEDVQAVLSEYDPAAGIAPGNRISF